MKSGIYNKTGAQLGPMQSYPLRKLLHDRFKTNPI